MTLHGQLNIFGFCSFVFKMEVKWLSVFLKHIQLLDDSVWVCMMLLKLEYFISYIAICNACNVQKRNNFSFFFGTGNEVLYYSMYLWFICQVALHFSLFLIISQRVVHEMPNEKNGNRHIIVHS